MRSGFATLLLAAAFSTSAAAEVDLRAGQWLVGVMIEITGGRGPNPGKLEQEMCLTPADAAKLVVPPGSPCRISGLRESAREITWQVDCRQGPMRTRGSGRLEFSGERFKGMVQTRADPPYEMLITQHMAGKRVGECKFPRKPAPELKKYEGG